MKESVSNTFVGLFVGLTLLGLLAMSASVTFFILKSAWTGGIPVRIDNLYLRIIPPAPVPEPETDRLRRIDG